jgi:signal transduction histidine kinase
MADTPPARQDARGWALLRDFARLLLLAVILPVAALAGLYLWQGASAAREEYARRLTAAADLAARDIDGFVQMHMAALQVLAEERSAAGALQDTGGWAADLERIHRYYPDFESLAVIDTPGRVVLVQPATPGASGRSVGDRSYYIQARRTGRAYLSDAYRGRVANDAPSVALAVPLTSHGEFAGVLGGAIGLDAFPAVRAQSSLAHGFEMLVLDRNDAVVHATHGLPYAPLDVMGRTGPDAALRSLSSSPRKMRMLEGVLRGGGNAYALEVPLRHGWRLVVLAPERAVAAELRHNTTLVLGLLLVVLLGVLGVAGAQMRRLGRFVRELLQRMQRFALDGADTGGIDTRGLPQELRPMAEALNELSARAREAYGAVNTSLQEQQRLRAELEAATRRLLTIQEDERNALSRELHDDIGQQITAIKLGATLLQEIDDEDERAQVLVEIMDTADETVAKVRNLSLLLRPPQIDSVGIEAALRWHAERVFRSGRTRLELDLQPLGARPAPEVELAAFRIAQEALTNVLRHSEASRVRVELSTHDGGRALRVSVDDDGVGFGPDHAPGLGLVTMRERARQLGGDLRVQGALGRGTRVEAILPMRPTAPH